MTKCWFLKGVRKSKSFCQGNLIFSLIFSEKSYYLLSPFSSLDNVELANTIWSLSLMPAGFMQLELIILTLEKVQFYIMYNRYIITYKTDHSKL